MGIDWYDMIAKRNGGYDYRTNSNFTVEGISGEDVFEERLIELLKKSQNVLDAGCGHGEFTLRMSKYTHKIIGFDLSVELLKIAEDLKKVSENGNKVDFLYCTTKKEMPFRDEEFDLIYTRRGPASILNHSRILKKGGIVFGIHSGTLEHVKEYITNNGFVDMEIEFFDNAIAYFPNEKEFMRFMSAYPGNPDFSLPENKPELDRLIKEHTVNDRLCFKEWRYIWKAKKP